MQNSLFRRTAMVIAAACCVLLIGCSPKFDWREVRGPDAPYVAMFPAKPDTHAREINLAGVPVKMTMTGAEIDGVTFAVGSIELADASQAQQALGPMKTAITRNIRANVVSERITASAPGTTTVELEARGPFEQGERLLLARFIAKGRHAYQMLVVGPADAVSPEAAETFLTSFRLPE